MFIESIHVSTTANHICKKDGNVWELTENEVESLISMVDFRIKIQSAGTWFYTKSAIHYFLTILQVILNLEDTQLYPPHTLVSSGCTLPGMHWNWGSLSTTSNSRNSSSWWGCSIITVWRLPHLASCLIRSITSLTFTTRSSCPVSKFSTWVSFSNFPAIHFITGWMSTILYINRLKTWDHVSRLNCTIPYQKQPYRKIVRKRE